MPPGTALKPAVSSWRAPELGGLDLLHGSFTTHVYARHTHETYSIGLMERGAMAFTCRGARHLLRPGLIGVIHPDEAHDGHAGEPGGWTYRNLYPDAALLASAFTPADGMPIGLPRLPVVIDDPALMRALCRAHAAFGADGASSLARESLMHLALTLLVMRHAARTPALSIPGTAPAALDMVRARLEDDYTRNVTLADLAAETGLNPFTLLRAFRRRYGLPPHAYQIQVRLRLARRLLGQGQTPARTAAEVGFADQSHLGRHFRGAYGVTPQQYRLGALGTGTSIPF